jgi:hypothetical protein
MVVVTRCQKRFASESRNAGAGGPCATELKQLIDSFDGVTLP